MSQVTTTGGVCVRDMKVEKYFLPVFEQLSACKRDLPTGTMDS